MMSRKEREALRDEWEYITPHSCLAVKGLRLLDEHEELLRRVREYLKECPGCDGNGIHRRIKTSGFINPTHALIKEPCKVCTSLREYVREDA